MIAFILFFVLALLALAVPIFYTVPVLTRIALYALSPLLLVAGFLIGSSVTVPSDQTGVVVRHVGKAMPPGAILARDGEQGPEAKPTPRSGAAPPTCWIQRSSWPAAASAARRPAS